MTSRPLRIRAAAAALLPCAVFLAVHPAAGQNFTWNGASGDDELWQNGDNWDGGDAPPFDLDGGSLIFGPTGDEQRPDARSDDYTNIGGPGGGLFFTGADEILTLVGSGSLSFNDMSFIRNDSDNSGDPIEQIINIDLIANGSFLIIDALNGDLTFGRSIDLSGDSGEDMVTLRVIGANATTFSGIIKGEGDLLLSGSGLVTLSGNNTYTGGTRLSGGATLLLGHDNALGEGDLSIQGLTANTIESDDDRRTIGNDVAIDLDAILRFSGDNDLTLDGVVSGEGDLEVDTTSGNVLLTLNGENTYTGDTIITAGTIVLGNDAALGEGNLVLMGDGVLRSSDGERVIANEIFLNNNDLRIEGANDLEFEGVLNDVLSNGVLTKAGTGTLKLSGDSEATFTGLVRINKGSLNLAGSVGGDINVNADGTLFGDGSLAGDLVNNEDGTVRIGNSIGTLTVGGNYTQADGSTLLVELSSDDLESDLLAVTGDAVLEEGSTIEALVTGECYIPSGQDFTILTAASIVDDGAEIVTDSATITFSLQRDGDFVGDGTDTSYALELFRASNAYANAARAGVNRTIGAALDSMQPIANRDPKGDAGRLLADLDRLNEEEYNTAVRQLSPEPYNAIASAVVDNAVAFTAQQSTYLATRRGGVPAMVQALHPVGPSPGTLAMAEDDPWVSAAAFAQAQTASTEPEPGNGRWSNYVKVQAVFSDQDTTPDRTGYSASLLGGQAGVDYSFSENLLAGLALGFTTTSADYADGLGDLDDETLRGGPYVSWTSGNFYVDGSVTFGYHFYDGSRNIPALGRVADSDFDGYDITGYVGAGYHYEIARDVFVTPIASVQYSHFDFDGFTETGAGGANLNVDSRTVDSLRSRLGANISLKLDWDIDIVPYFFVGWEHEFMDDEDVAARFAPGSSPFLIDTGNPAKDSVFVGGGANILLKHNVSAFVRYEGSFSDDSDVSGIAGGISIAF